MPLYKNIIGITFGNENVIYLYKDFFVNVSFTDIVEMARTSLFLLLIILGR